MLCCAVVCCSRAPMLTQSMPTLALVPRNNCKPTSQIKRCLSCTSCWPGQAPQPVQRGHQPAHRDHRSAPSTATLDAGAAALRWPRPSTRRSTARTKASATPKVSSAPCAVLWGAPLAAALAQDARCSAPSQTKAACLCKSIRTDLAPRPKTPAPMMKACSADGPQKAAAVCARIHQAAADRPPRQGVRERAVDEMRRRLHHQPHANLRSPRLMPLCPAQRQAKQPARRQPQLKNKFKPPNGRKQLQR